MNNELTAQQKRFCVEYIQNKRNGTQAAIVAGYSKKTAHVQASQLLKKLKIRAYIEKLFSENIMSASESLSLLTDIARGIRKDADVNHQLTALKEIAKYHNLTNNSTVRIEDWQTEAIEAIRKL